MAERITEEQVEHLIAVLRNENASIDTKVNTVNAAKSSIKQHNVPDVCVIPLFDALRKASSTQHAILVNAGFTALNHLLTRMSRQDPKWLSKDVVNTLPLVVDKLGDLKEKFRQLALQALATMYKVAPLETERAVRNTAMVGKNPRAKEASLHFLLQMHQENGLQFRGYVPTLMELLEDADAMVRETAKLTVIELFKNAPNAAKSDLKRQLTNFKVRPAIAQAIIKELNPATSAPASQTSALEEQRPASRANLAASVSSLPTDRPITPMDSTRTDTVEPMYINTNRELDDIFREIHMWFDGKETEQNWLKREESIIKLRKLIAGNAATDFAEPYLTGLRGLLDGMIKGVVSLRTSLSKESCSLVQDIARAYGPAMDPMVEILMQTFIKLCAATKKIASQQANTTVDTIIAKVSYTPRIMQHIWLAVQDKNVNPRLYSSGWLQTLLVKEAHHKNHVEHTGGLDLIEKSIKKGLGDANPTVREKMRATYWKFSTIWPARADAIMDGLDATAQKLLRNDPHNPASPKRAAAGPSGGSRPGLGLSKSTMGAPKPSIRETIMAQKKAMASSSSTTAKAPQARPGSAMAHFSPVRTTAPTSQTSTTTTTSTVRTRPESTIMGSTGGISGAPMRPGRRRPEMAPRPATAGPYSVRSHDQPSSEQKSPPNSRSKSVITPKTISTSPKRSVPKTFQPSHSTSSLVESNLPTPTRGSTPKFESPRATPSRLARSLDMTTASSPRAHEEFSAVIPTISVLKNTPPRERQSSPSLVESAPIVRAISEPPAYEESVAPEVPKHTSQPLRSADVSPTSRSPPLKVFEDPFTGDKSQQLRSSKPIFDTPVLEEKPVNADAANLQRISTNGANGITNGEIVAISPEKAKQNLRLLESGITKIKQQSLDVHGFRKLQGIIRDSKALITDDKFDALLSGLFEFLEAPALPHLAPDKVQDVKAQILATIKVMLKRLRENFRPHVSRGLESLLRSRAAYEGRTHMVSGLELLASELVTLGDASEITVVLGKMLNGMDVDSAHDLKSLSMGLHVLKEMIDNAHIKFVPTEGELELLASLAARCLESGESAVRMDAVALCVALHARVGDARFWEAVKGVREDPKSLITYYIVRRQRENGVVGANGSASASASSTSLASAATPAA
ncbi:protein STU1 [Podospora fimiseda]|uniref:Protein STU1 n=1 Tax=Podospora fimiseda TaxID=252190 RepID=A0AAN7BR21_9PEZI|nr:protein STU1 [Podospora fimiseda]